MSGSDFEIGRRERLMTSSHIDKKIVDRQLAIKGTDYSEQQQEIDEDDDVEVVRKVSKDSINEYFDTPLPHSDQKDRTLKPENLRPFVMPKIEDYYMNKYTH